MEPLISCCIITFNHAPYIKQAIESVLNQKHHYSFEIIIADDCSTDGTTGIIKKYQEEYPSLIKVIIQPVNVGASKNFTGLLKAARGKYIAYLEGDDYWKDELKLQKQIDFLEHNPDYSICFTDVLETFSEDLNDPRNVLHGGSGSKSTTTINDLLYENYIQTVSVIFKNKLFPYFPDWYADLMPGDWPLHILNAQFGKIFYFDECMCVHRNYSDGLWSSQKKIKRIENTLNVCNVIGKELNLVSNKNLKAGISKLLLSSVKYLLKEQRYFSAVKNIFSAVFIYPEILLFRKK
jgi:glycosyltransferase involved in cell wall biosynthesis